MVSIVPTRRGDATEAVRRTLIEIDLDALSNNLAILQRRTQAGIVAVVKANAYGHGARRVGLQMQRHGAAGLAVALAEEGLDLRDAGVRIPILVLNGVYGGAHREILERKLTPVVYRLEDVAAFHTVVRPGEEPAKVHLKVDTGMGRLGVPLRELAVFLGELDKYPSVSIRGVMTHFASADDDLDFTHQQLARFHEAIALIRSYGHEPSCSHVGNSAALFHVRDSHLDWIRCGTAIYGDAGFPGGPDLVGAMRWTTTIADIRTLEPGESAGYSRSFVATERCRVATVPVGYADGYLRAHSRAHGVAEPKVFGKGEVLVGGVRCPVAGNVSMDLTAIDISACPRAQVGDEVVLLGPQGEDEIRVRELAQSARVLPYEIWTSISERVPRVYRLSSISPK